MTRTDAEAQLDRPSAYAVSTTLRNGLGLTIRSIKPDDRDAEAAFFSGLSPRSRHSRFFSAIPHLTEDEIDYLTDVDFDRHVALVAHQSGDANGPILGIARYIVTDAERPDRAEVACVVADAYQRLGIATALLRHLVALARDSGVQEFHASVLAQNYAVLKLFQDCRLPRDAKTSDGITDLLVQLSPDPCPDHRP